MSEFTIYHNPRCSKSRQTLALLEEKGADLSVVEYLKEPMSAAKIKNLLQKLSLQASGLIRNKDKLFKELNLSGCSESELLKAMVQNPTLIERPIVVRGEHAVLGRPPENINALF